MVKIGVLSLYYNNYNYGGLLQAYALIYELKKLGFDAEQISFDLSTSPAIFKKTKIEKLKNDPFGYVYKNTFGKLAAKVFHDSHEDFITQKTAVRRESFRSFMETIPHSRVYTSSDIASSNDVYDIFLCGSDQVWNPSYLRSEFLLDFVQPEKKKYSYAASIGKDNLNPQEVAYLNAKTQDYTAVSLREKACMAIFDRETTWVLDPTMLLDKNEWRIVSKEYPINGKYIFVYFLGDTKEHRTAVIEYAKKHNLKIVTFPHILNQFRESDDGFADYEIYDADPAHFLYLIDHSECVFTDSFHAAIFSCMFEKHFLVFERDFKDKKERMNSRLISLLGLLNQTERLCSANDFSESVLMKPNDAMQSEAFMELHRSSVAFLRHLG